MSRHDEEEALTRGDGIHEPEPAGTSYRPRHVCHLCRARVHLPAVRCVAEEWRRHRTWQGAALPRKDALQVEPETAKGTPGLESALSQRWDRDRGAGGTPRQPDMGVRFCVGVGSADWSGGLRASVHQQELGGCVRKIVRSTIGLRWTLSSA